MKKKGITDYKSFALDVIKITKDKPISFEIFADELDEMYKQATEISKWGKNVNVKIPITNTNGKSTKDLIKTLSDNNIGLQHNCYIDLRSITRCCRYTEP